MRKHSESSLVVVSVTVGAQAVPVAVQDAGVGLPVNLDPGQTYGLRAIQSAVAKLFGTFEVLTNNEGGTTIRATLPYESAS